MLDDRRSKLWKKLKYGEYVRTDYGISKVVPKINVWITNEQVTLDLYNGIRNITIFKNIVKKHSKDIIDLIEKRGLCKWKRSYI